VRVHLAAMVIVARRSWGSALVEGVRQVPPLVAAARRSPARALVVFLVAGALLTSGVSYGRAQNRLGDTRAQLAAASESLDSVRRELEQTQDGRAATEAETEEARSEIGMAVDTRAWIEGLTTSTQAEIGVVDANQAQVDTARFLVAHNAGVTQACLGGVSQAVGASRRGDDQAAVGALQATHRECAQTLAYASGARFAYDFADPFVLRVGDVFYGYSTNAGAGDIQVIRSSNLVEWDLVGNALAGLPAWAAPGSTWAPAVLQRGGMYVAYYTVRDAVSGRQCISRALAAAPEGPFVDGSTGPLTCDLVGSIDTSPFVDGDGRAYLLWKSEGPGGPPALWSQELTPDGLGLVGLPRRLMSVDRSFERGVVEAPTMVYEAGRYTLLYAGADWSSEQYTTAYATCAGPSGPCTKPRDGRVLSSGDVLAGPGGAEVFRDRDGVPWVAFHAYSRPNVGYPSSRYLHIARLHITPTSITIDAPT
jgi:hypothetical protein